MSDWFKKFRENLLKKSVSVEPEDASKLKPFIDPGVYSTYDSAVDRAKKMDVHVEKARRAGLIIEQIKAAHKHFMTSPIPEPEYFDVSLTRDDTVDAMNFAMSATQRAMEREQRFFFAGVKDRTKFIYVVCTDDGDYEEWLSEFGVSQVRTEYVPIKVDDINTFHTSHKPFDVVPTFRAVENPETAKKLDWLRHTGDHELQFIENHYNDWRQEFGEHFAKQIQRAYAAYYEGQMMSSQLRMNNPITDKEFYEQIMRDSYAKYRINAAGSRSVIKTDVKHHISDRVTDNATVYVTYMTAQESQLKIALSSYTMQSPAMPGYLIEFALRVEEVVLVEEDFGYRNPVGASRNKREKTLFASDYKFQLKFR